MYFNQMEFGQRVKALRKENGLTLQQMADELNLSYEHYKKIENEPDHIILCVSVRDTGIGIKAEDMKKLFSEFERIEEERNR